MMLYSHSRISSFENCRLQYRYRYIDKVKVDTEGVEALMGKLVHEVLEGLYTKLDDARRRVSELERLCGSLDEARQRAAEEIGERFDRLWQDRFGPRVRIVRPGMTPDDYRAAGRRCVEVYFKRHHPFEAGRVVGVEERLIVTIGERRHQVQGYVDRIDRVGDDVWEIHDYKTGGLPRAGALKRDRQLSLYEIGLRQKYGRLPRVRQIWHYLAHDQRFVEERSLDDLQRVRQQTIAAIQTIEATTDFPPTRSALCSWCEFQDICPEWARERAAGDLAAGADLLALDAADAPPDPAPAPATASGGIPAIDLPVAGAAPRSGQYRLFE